MFPAFVIQNLWVCSVASLQEMYSVGCFSSICVGGCVFPALVIQNLWVCTIVSLQECAARNVAAQAVAPVYVWVAVCFLPS